MTRLSAIDRATHHFESQETKIIEVAEWGDEDGNPLIIHAEPMTLAEKNKLYKMARNDDLSLMVYCLIMKAKDTEGNKLFTLNDKKALMEKADSDVVARIAATILGGEASVQDQLGN
jgi:hypothetical protein